MKITKLSAQERNSERVNLYLDEKFAVGLSINTVAKYNLFIGKEINESEYLAILHDDLGERFFNRAVDYLGSSIKTEMQIRKYLRNLLFRKKGLWYKDLDKDNSEKLLAGTMEKLAKYSYLNDEEFAEMFIESRIKNKPRGKNVLFSELLSKGVPKEIAEKKVNELVVDEYDMLKRVYEKKYKGEKITKLDRKKIDFLLRKGFSWDLIERYIDNESEK